jgi:hypothetical protein
MQDNTAFGFAVDEVYWLWCCEEWGIKAKRVVEKREVGSVKVRMVRVFCDSAWGRRKGQVKRNIVTRLRMEKMLAEMAH